MRPYTLPPSQQVMKPSITLFSTRDDAHVHARNFLGYICLQYITLSLMYNNSRSLIIDSHPSFAMDNTFMIEGSFQTDFTAIKSSTTFNSLSSSPEAVFLQQQLEHAPQHLLLHADRELPFHAAPSASGIVRVASNTDNDNSEMRYASSTHQQHQYQIADSYTNDN